MPSSSRQLHREEAQTAVEYTAMLGLITLAIVLAIGALSGSLEQLFARVADVFS